MLLGTYSFIEEVIGKLCLHIALLIKYTDYL